MVKFKVYIMININKMFNSESLNNLKIKKNQNKKN